MNGLVVIDRKGEIGGRHTLSGAPFEALLEWRPRPGEAVTVADPDFSLYRARVLTLGNADAELLVFEWCGRLKDAGPEVTLLQALPDKERMELIIQKTTELGVARIVPFTSKKSVTLTEREASQKKAHRWPETALKAARQSRRATIPVVSPCAGFAEALEAARGAALKVALWERQGLRPLKEIVRLNPGASAVALLSGPEGGLEDEEIRAAEAAGFHPATLGQNILRAETAPIAALAVIMHLYGA